jgi:maleate cis-trans isomerase
MEEERTSKNHRAGLIVPSSNSTVQTEIPTLLALGITPRVPGARRLLAG